MKTLQCSSCGAPLEQYSKICSYCRSVFADPIENKIDNMVFKNGYPLYTNISSATPYGYFTNHIMNH